MVLDHDCQGGSGTLPSVYQDTTRKRLPSVTGEGVGLLLIPSLARTTRKKMRKAQHTGSGRDFLDTAKQAWLSTITDNLNFINIEAFHTSGQY